MTDNVMVSSVKLGCPAGYTAVYCGRGRAPAGMEQANLGNPFKVGKDYAQGEAAAAYLTWLRERVQAGGHEREVILRLAGRVRVGEKLCLMCWCKQAGREVPCHCDHIRAAVLGYARKGMANR